MKLCQVCFSKYGEEYDRRKDNGATLKELEEYSEEVGENIKVPTFSYHFRRNHNEEYREEVVNDWVEQLFTFKEDAETKIDNLDKILNRQNNKDLEEFRDKLRRTKAILERITEIWLKNKLDEA